MPSKTGTAKFPGKPDRCMKRSTVLAATWRIASKSSSFRGALYLFADRTSSWWMSSNQLRLYFSTIAYIFFVHLRRTIQQVSGDETRNMSSTIRLRMLKVSAAVKITVRRVWISLPESFPWWDIWIRTSCAI